MSGFDCDVLVVGLGPVGDMMAILAAQQGLKVIGVERATDLFPLPRAAIFDQEIMRIFQLAGVADRALAIADPITAYQFVTAAGEVLLDFPIAAQGALGWAETYAFHQPSLERLLRARCAELDIALRLGTSFTGLDQDDDGATVRLSSDAGAATVRARFVIGCDGAGSQVRSALGIALEDLGFDEPWLVIDTVGGGTIGGPRIPRQICDPRRPVTHGPLHGTMLRWEFMLKPGEDPAEFARPANVRALLEPWGYGDRLTIERQAVYRFHALIAREWRKGRVLLAGDAAHQMPPFAGQGMCSGIRDAVNLAWKLAAVIRGGADLAILDSYQEEREPHARVIVETAIAMGRVVCLLDEQAAAARDAGMLARKAAGEQDVTTAYPDLCGGLLTDSKFAGALFPQPVVDGVRMDDVLGPGPVLIGRDLPPLDLGAVRAIDLADAAFAPFAVAIAAWLAEAGAACVLVRPDRHVFGTGSPGTLVNQWSDRLRLKIAV